MEQVNEIEYWHLKKSKENESELIPDNQQTTSNRRATESESKINTRHVWYVPYSEAEDEDTGQYLYQQAVGRAWLLWLWQHRGWYSRSGAQ